MRKYIYPKGLVLGYFLESMANNGVEYSLKRGHGSMCGTSKMEREKRCMFSVVVLGLARKQKRT